MPDPFETRFKTLFQSLFASQDILAFVVRGHLYCEATITRILEQAVKRSGALDIQRLDYQMKVNLASAFALIPEYLIPGLTQLGKLRNRYAHTMDYEATRKDQSDLINTLRSSMGEPAQYYLSRQTEFPNGLRRCVLPLWLQLELSTARDKTEAGNMAASVISSTLQLTDFDPETFIGEMRNRMEEFMREREGST